MAKKEPMPWLKPAVLVGALLPLGDMAIGAWRGTLGANAIAEVLNRLGLLALVMLILALACTPAKVLFGWTWPIRIRRYLGNLGFSYAALHFFFYAVVDQSLALPTILEDIAKRPFILVGFSALVLLTPLAVTSTDAMVRRLGFARWKRLHRLAYVATALGGLHFWLRVKKDHTEPAIYGTIILLLLAVRAVDALRKRAAKKAKQTESSLAA